MGLMWKGQCRMKYLCKNIMKELLSHKSQILILFFLAILTSGMFFFVRFSIDSNEKEMNQYTAKQNQEDFRFIVDCSASKRYKAAIIKRYNLNDKEVEKYGLSTVLKKKNIRLSKLNEGMAYDLAKKYGFEYEERRIVTINDRNYTYYGTNAMKNINLTYIIEGALPTNKKEIAFPYKYLEMNNLNIKDRVVVDGKEYIIVGSISLPDYLLFQPFGELQKGYDKNSFAIVTDDVIESYASDKFTSYYCGKVIGGNLEEVIEELQKEETILYVEGTNKIESDSAPIRAFHSNKLLAFTFLFGLLLISAYIYFLFVSKFIEQNRKMIGAIMALGYKKVTIIKALIMGTLPFILLGSTLGCIIGKKLSGVLVNRYIHTFMFTDFKTGISLKMLVIGIGALPIMICILIIVTISILVNEDIAILMGSSKVEKENKVYNKMISFMLSTVKDENKFSYKTILRKKNSILLTIVAMIAVGTLFITSISLYFSSINVFSKQFEGQNYQYIYTTDYYVDDDFVKESDNCIVTTSNVVSDHPCTVKLYGLKAEMDYFKLYSPKNELIFVKGDGVIISKGFSVLYGIGVGDSIVLTIGNEKIECAVSNICQNGALYHVYMEKGKLADVLDISGNVSNVFYSNIEQNIDGASRTTIDEQMQAEKYNQNSNKSSAVINQVIGIVFAILMFFLVMILIIQENQENIRILLLLGYKEETAVKLVLGKYRFFISLILLLTMPVSLHISYSIHLGISRGTNDYIPFSWNIIVLLALFLIVNILYTILYTIYRKRIKVV